MYLNVISPHTSTLSIEDIKSSMLIWLNPHVCIHVSLKSHAADCVWEVLFPHIESQIQTHMLAYRLQHASCSWLWFHAWSCRTHAYTHTHSERTLYAIHCSSAWDAACLSIFVYLEVYRRKYVSNMSRSADIPKCTRKCNWIKGVIIDSTPNLVCWIKVCCLSLNMTDNMEMPRIKLYILNCRSQENALSVQCTKFGFFALITFSEKQYTFIQYTKFDMLSMMSEHTGVTVQSKATLNWTSYRCWI